jgi:hypothetical protein
MKNLSNSYDKWNWMMDYCKQQRIPPAQKWAWDKANAAWHQSQQQ